MAARRACILTSLLAACVLAACGGSSSSSTSSKAAASSTTTTSTMTASSTASPTAGLGPEAIVLETGTPLAPASSTTQGATVDGIQCAPVEQLAYHIHAHLQVYDHNQSRVVPGAIGIVGPVAQQTPEGSFYGPGQCIYWLHTHTSDGVIHIESPTVRVYTLGNFFDEWRQPLSRTQVASAKGKVTAFLNGKLWTKDPRAIPLVPHAAIQLDVGSATAAPKSVDWSSSNL